MSRVVLVVGASSGIGRATAHVLAERGDHLVLAARGKRALDRAAQECRERGAAGVSVVPVDIRDRDAVDALVESVITEHARLDAVVQAAGVVAYGRFEDIPADVFDAVVQTNLLGTANVARAVLPVLRCREEGHLVLLGSVLGEIGVPRMAPYVVSKWGVRALGRQLALENRDLDGVRISVVSPGGVDTPIYRKAANYQGFAGRPPAPVMPAERVAQALVAALDKPRDRISVGPLNPLMRWGFQLLPGPFDRLVGPLFDLLAGKPVTVAPTTGNVLEPLEEHDEVEGGEGPGLPDAVTNAVSR